MLAYLKSIYLLTKAQITIFRLAVNPIKFSKRLLRWDLKIVFIFLIMPWKTNSDSVNNIKIVSYMSYSRSICTCTSHTQANSLGPLSEKLYKAWMQRWGSQQHSPTSGSIRFMGALVSRTHWWHWGRKGSWQQKTHSSSTERDLRARLWWYMWNARALDRGRVVRCLRKDWTLEWGWGLPGLFMGPLPQNKRERIRTCRV